MARQLSRVQMTERSITKQYRERIWNPFIRAVKEYRLIEEGDRIAVCLEANSSSVLLCKAMQLLHRYSDFPFEVHFIAVSHESGDGLGIPVEAVSGDITEHVLRLGCNKLAACDSFSDVIEEAVTAMLCLGSLRAILPKEHVGEHPGLELIRPLYCVRRDDILAWCRYNELPFADRETDSGHEDTRALIQSLRKTNPNIEKSIFHSLHALHIDTFPGYSVGGEAHSFLERYDSKDIQNLR